ncbi:MAG: hypothetical protein HUU02_01610 [Bacteroidetes bacterium]|nr:hypothetical protein [Bacteroidota bacterium]
MKAAFRALVLTVLVIGSMQTAMGQRTIRMNIERIVSDAAIIVRGTVVKVESATDPVTNILSTFVTIQVQQNLYGAPESMITLKMIGGSNSKRTLRFSEMPRYTAGQEIIGLFFAPSKSGFTSPVGMGQGTFTVVKDAASDAPVVRIGADHPQLFAGIKLTKTLARSSWLNGGMQTIDADEFTQTLRNLITELKK